MKCPQCSFENEDGVAFCENCGEVFPAGSNGTPAPAAAATAEVPVIDIPEVKTPSTDAEARGEVLSDIPAVLKVPEVAPPAPGKPRRSTVADLAPRSDDPAGPDFSGFERLVDSSYVPPEVQQAGDTAEIPRIAGDYVPRARTYDMGLTEKELRRRDRRQKRMAKKFARMQEREEMRRAKEALRAEKERLRKDPPPVIDPEVEAMSAETALAVGASAIVVADQGALTAREAAGLPAAGTGEVALAVPGATAELATMDSAGEPASLAAPAGSAAAAGASPAKTAALDGAAAAADAGKAAAPAAEPAAKGGSRKAGRAAKKKDAAKGAAPEAPRETAGNPRTSRPSRRAIPKAPIIAAACLVVALGLVGTAWGTYHAEMWGGKTIPEVVGLSQEDATAALGERGFVVDVAEEKSDAAPGTVLAATPDQGTRAEEGSTVAITVAAPRVVPAVVGLSQQEAADALAAEGLGAVEVVEQKSNEAEGSVLAVTPEAGATVLSTDPVTLTVAVPYTVPDVGGMDETGATEALEAEGYTADVRWSYSEEVDEGTVLSTEPEAGTQLDSGSEVVVYLAKSRANELVALAQEILPGARLKSGDERYIIDEVKSVSYAGDDVVKYTCTAHQYEDVTLPFGLGKQRYEDDKKVDLSGTLTFNGDNEVTTADPSISYS